MTTAWQRGAAWALAPAPAAIAGLVAALAGCAGPALDARHREQGRRFAAAEPTPAAPVAQGVAEPALTALARLEREPLVAEVLKRNPSLEAMRQAWKAALERYPQDTSLDDPRLGYAAAPRSFGSSRVSGGQRVDLAQRLPFPGKLALRGESALALADAAHGEFEGERLRLAEAASLLFDDYYLAVRAIEINAAHTALLEELREVATARYAAGETSQQDPLEAEVELAHALHDAHVLETERRLAVARIDALLHRSPEAGLPPPPDTLAPPLPLELDGEALTQRALRERPDLRAAEARVRAQESALALARREFLPDVTLVGGYDAFWQEKELRPAVGLQLDLPIRLARRHGALDEAQARLAQAQGERAALEDAVRLEVKTGVDRLEEASHVLRLLQDRTLPASRDRVDAARAGFETGRNDFDALIEAQRTLRDAELDRERALAELSRRHAELQRATGALAGLR
jgi:cobalt-zinc-cadmium efflux system outer membrane protein